MATSEPFLSTIPERHRPIRSSLDHICVNASLLVEAEFCSGCCMLYALSFQDSSMSCLTTDCLLIPVAVLIHTSATNHPQRLPPYLLLYRVQADTPNQLHSQLFTSLCFPQQNKPSERRLLLPLHDPLMLSNHQRIYLRLYLLRNRETYHSPACRHL